MDAAQTPPPAPHTAGSARSHGAMEPGAAPHTFCFNHRRALVGLCETCNRPVCDACQACIEAHPVKLFDELIAETFPQPLSAAQVREAAAAAQRHISTVYTETNEAERVARDAERKVRACAEFVTDADKIRANDVHELARMRDELAAACNRADTAAARNAFAAARDKLDVEAQVDAELAHYRRTHTQAKMALTRTRATAARMQGRLAIFTFTAELSEFPSDAPGQTALALSMRAADATFATQAFGYSCSVAGFTAFRGAAELAVVAAALKKPLRTVGPIQVGDAVEVPWLPKGRRCDPIASLSSCGILCVGDDTESLLVTHLPSRRAVVLNCSRYYNQGFVYGADLFVAQSGRASLFHAPAEAVLAGEVPFSDFQEFRLAAEWGYTPRLDSVPRGQVFVCRDKQPDNALVIDLQEKTSRLVPIEQELPYFGGFSGIDVPGVAWAATTENFSQTNDVFAVAPDGTKKVIARRMYMCPTVLPSAAAPADLTRAAVLDFKANLSVGGARAQLTDPVKPDCQALVRLHRDVFLCLDARTSAWFALRIVVP